MPIYTVELDGKKFDIQGDKTPTESDVRQAVSEYSDQDIPVGFENPMDVGTTSSEAKPSSGISGVNAVATEVGRGLGVGTGQLVADAGWLMNGAGSFNNGIGNAINQYGRDLMGNSANLPATDITGFAKGALNFAGQAAPMVASFGAGEFLGAAKIGELATDAVASLNGIRRADSLVNGVKVSQYVDAAGVATSAKARAIGAFDMARKSMGAGTLFGVVNAIDTVSTMPQHTEMKDQINEIMNSATTGFITGATLTPLLDVGAQVLSKYGSKALRAYTIGLTGSEQAADKVYDLTRNPGTYEAVMKVDPTAPAGKEIEMQLVNAVDVSKGAETLQHENMSRQLDLSLRDVKDTHDLMKTKLSDEILTQRTKFEEAQRQIDHEVELSLKDIRLEKEGDLSQTHGDAVQNSVKSLQNGVTGNSQQLQLATNAFDAHIQSALDLADKAKESTYGSVIKTAPADGFSVKGLVANIQGMLQKEYGIKLSKDTPLPTGIDLEKLSPAAREQVLQMGSNRPAVWTATSRAAGQQVRPEALRMVKYLTETLLPSLEEKLATNNGVVTLDMLRETTKNIKDLGYDAPGIKNPGFANLDRVLRPNSNIGEILDKDGNINMGQRGSFVGSDTSLAALKQAGLLDKKVSNILSLKNEYETSIRPSVEAKAKAFGKDLATTETLSKLEAMVDLPVDSELRLSNSMKKYYDTNTELVSTHEKNNFLLEQKLRIQKNRIEDELATERFKRREERIGAKQTEQTRYLDERRSALEAKVTEMRRIGEVREAYNRAVLTERTNREAALNEVRAVGRGDIPLGRIQRSFVTGAGYGFLFGNFGAAIPSAAAASILSPKIGLPIIRGILKSSKSGVLGRASSTLAKVGQNRLLRQLIIGNTLRKKY